MDPLGQLQERRTQSLLSIALSAAVPMRIMEIIQRGGITDEDIARIKSYGEDLMGPNGPDLFFRSKKAGGTAERFNQVADALAVLAFFPGGITAFGDHYDAEELKAALERVGKLFDEVLPGEENVPLDSSAIQ